MNKDIQNKPDILYKPHPHPVWYEQANSLILAHVEHAGPSEIKEQLWARQLADNRFEICCIPFFIFDLALGDHVETSSDGVDHSVVQRVVRRSGNHTYWIWFNSTADEVTRLRVRDKVAQCGCLLEWCYYDLLAFNVMPDRPAELLIEALQDETAQGLLECVSSRTTFKT